MWKVLGYLESHAAESSLPIPTPLPSYSSVRNSQLTKAVMLAFLVFCLSGCNWNQFIITFLVPSSSPWSPCGVQQQWHWAGGCCGASACTARPHCPQGIIPLVSVLCASKISILQCDAHCSGTTVLMAQPRVSSVQLFLMWAASTYSGSWQVWRGRSQALLLQQMLLVWGNASWFMCWSQWLLFLLVFCLLVALLFLPKVCLP